MTHPAGRAIGEAAFNLGAGEFGGATVYLHEFAPGRFNAVIEGKKGIITTMGNWSQKSINRIAKNYGWNIE